MAAETLAKPKTLAPCRAVIADEPGEPETQERLERRLTTMHQALRRRAEEQLDERLTAIERLDRLLVWADRLLYWSQPPATGRIRVAWQKKSVASDTLAVTPKLVSWIKINRLPGRERWRSRVLVKPRNAIHGRGGFALHRDEVEALVVLADDLLAQRATLMAQLGNAGRSWTQKRRVVSAQEATVIETLLAVIKRLNAKGLVQLVADDVLR